MKKEHIANKDWSSGRGWRIVNCVADDTAILNLNVDLQSLIKKTRDLQGKVLAELRILSDRLTQEAEAKSEPAIELTVEPDTCEIEDIKGRLLASIWTWIEEFKCKGNVYPDKIRQTVDECVAELRKAIESEKALPEIINLNENTD